MCDPLATDSPGSVERFHPARLLIAVLGGAILILSAPFIGQIRGVMRAAFPSQFVRIVDAAVGVALVTALAGALYRIRTRRLIRYTMILGALVLAATYIAALSTGHPEVDSVERVHFVEYGLITLMFYRVWSYRRDVSVIILPALGTFIVGILEEWFQWFVPVRVGEFRDVLLNSTAIACGLLLSMGLEPPATLAWRLRLESRRLVGLIGASAVLLFAVFLHVVHVGYEIHEPGIGTFRSHYTRTELLNLATDRAVRWRRNPPIVLRRLSREDQYMDEALWHVQHRNEAWSNGRFFDALHENQILERFYWPVLDAPSYVSPTGHRWPAEHRADAVRRAGERALVQVESGSTLPGYVSRAHRYPIVAWPKAVFWPMTVAVVVTILASCWPRQPREQTTSP